MSQLIENEEIINDEEFVVTEKRKQVWQVVLECFKQFLDICEKNQLKYYFIYGSLLGAVRHGGFIPWDDDIDILMPREDYELFIKYAKNELKPPYVIQTSDCTDEFCCGFSRIRNSETTALIKGQWSNKTKMNLGIFIDIFPADSCPDNVLKRFVHKIVARILNVSSNSVMFDLTLRPNDLKELSINIIRRILRVIPPQTIVSWRDKWIAMYNGKNQKQIGALTLEYHKSSGIWDADLFKESLLVPFEHYKVLIPMGYEKILEKTYGNWKTPVKFKSSHEGTYFDPFKPYTFYIKRFDEYKNYDKKL
jgi:lipopolysaccharide cholinephosphotransferase